ncbi:MAG TPA: sulfite exporter TauE/SafE family protein [Gammaproteobacteria bacterium]|nr:sulfite exporter TauE/SafE family protein [Gammaproteobacteria bacterium]
MLDLLDINIVDAALYCLTGAFAGFAAGLLGIGGGLIIVPVLFYIFSTQHYDQQYLMHMALATSLATIIITSISSTLAHHKKNAVLWHTVILLLPGIGLGSWFGASFAARLDTATLKPLFGIFEIFVAILMISQYQSKQHQRSIKTINGFIGGGLIGSISAIVGIGGGTLTVPFLHWHRINIKNAIATSAACGLPIAIFATASYVFSGWNMSSDAPDSQQNLFGFVQLQAFLLIAASSFLFAPLGAKFAHSISDVLLKKIFSVFLLLLGLKMLLS